MSAIDATAHAMGAHGGSARTSPVSAPLGIRAMFGLMMVIGAATFLLEVRVDPTRAYAAFLLGFWFFVGLGLGGTFFTAIQHLTGATWSIVVRRVAESFASYLPVALLLLLVVLLGIPHLYVWSTQTAGAEAAELSKGGYLTTPLFVLRAGVILAIWSLFSWYLVRNSTRQDVSRDPSISKSSLKASAAFIVIFAVTVTVASFDFLMSLEPTWYSTIFGVYCFAGLWQAGLAAMVAFDPAATAEENAAEMEQAAGEVVTGADLGQRRQRGRGDGAGAQPTAGGVARDAADDGEGAERLGEVRCEGGGQYAEVELCGLPRRGEADTIFRSLRTSVYVRRRVEEAGIPACPRMRQHQQYL
jgi:hypothetical protein